MQSDNDQNIDEIPDRRILVRDIAVLQVKLVVDGLRDVILVPVSLVTGLISLLGGGSKPGTEFYDLLRLGRRSERWINLFGAAERVHGPAAPDESLLPEDIDQLATRVESYVIDEYRRGGVTKQAKDRLDRVLGSLSRRKEGSQLEDSDGD